MISASTRSARSRWTRCSRRNSGHPGTPMALAPVAYTLWQRFLRFDPEDPIWPNRDRFVLSSGHASMLLYAMLHLAGVRAVNADYERLGEPSVTLDDIKHFRQLDSKCPGHPEYHLTSGVETTTGPLGQGCGNSVGMAIAGALARAPLQPARLHAVRLRRLRALQRRRHDGGRRERGGFARRPPQALEPVLDLRRQPHHDRRPHRARLQRGRCGALSRLRLERACAWPMPTTRSGSRARFEIFRRTDDRPTLIIVDSHIGYGAPHKQDTSSRARRAAGRGRGPARQGELRLARGRAVPGAGRRLRALPGGHRRSAGASCARPGRPCSSATAAHHPELADQIERMQRRELPEGWDADLPSSQPTPRASPAASPRARC